MSRDGLTEKNLRDGSSENISQRAGELPKIRSPEATFRHSVKEKPEDGETKTSKKNRRYQTIESKDRMSEPPARAAPFRAAPLENNEEKGNTKRQKQARPVKDKEETEQEVSQEEALLEDGSQTPLRNSMRMEGVRQHSAGSTGAYVRGATEAGHLRKKKMVQSYARKKDKTKTEQDLEDFREEIDKKEAGTG